jgi:hypothetical protein
VRLLSAPSCALLWVINSASYHHQLNRGFYPEGVTAANASKGINAHLLRAAGCTSLTVMRGGAPHVFRVPAEEPPQWTQHRAGVAGVKAPTSGEAGKVYQKGPAGPIGPELTAATFQYLTTHKPEALDSKVEKQFRALGWEIIWTPPYCPKFQLIELVWGIGKQLAGTLYRAGRTREATRRHLRRGWYGGKGKGTARFMPCDVHGCWKTSKREMGL